MDELDTPYKILRRAIVEVIKHHDDTEQFALLNGITGSDLVLRQLASIYRLDVKYLKRFLDLSDILDSHIQKDEENQKTN